MTMYANLLNRLEKEESGLGKWEDYEDIIQEVTYHQFKRALKYARQYDRKRGAVPCKVTLNAQTLMKDIKDSIVEDRGEEKDAHVIYMSPDLTTESLVTYLESRGFYIEYRPEHDVQYIWFTIKY